MPVSGLFDDAQHAYASPEELPHALRQRCHGDWVVQGRGLFTWSVFRVYEVSLLVQQRDRDRFQHFGTFCPRPELSA
jgi:hypothetical protein